MTKEQRGKLIERLSLVGIVPCGDSSCVIAPPSGMATNGGCRCVSASRTSLEAKRLAMALAYVLRAYAEESQP